MALADTVKKPDIIGAAKWFAEHGFSVLPVAPTKHPAVPERLPSGSTVYTGSWAPMQSSILKPESIPDVFAKAWGVAVVCGRVSRNLECLDFDIDGFWPGVQEVLISWDQQALVDKLNVICKTPGGGYHVLIRCESEVAGNTKLAYQIDETSKDGKRIAIETRGEGGYFVTYPTPGYEIHSGRFVNIPVLTTGERETLMAAARSLNEVYTENLPNRIRPDGDRSRPGDDYNYKCDFDRLVQEVGWTPVRGGTNGNRAYRRPGGDGIGATMKDDLFYVFTTNAYPLEANRAYTPFQFRAVTQHAGNYSECAAKLAQEGFGSQTQRNHVVKTYGLYAIYESDPLPDDEPGFGALAIEDVEKEFPKWLFEPYVRLEQLNLLDAAEGAGKTTLCLALAAAGANGVGIHGEPMEPFATLYFGSEDSPGEIKVAYERVGGPNGGLYIVNREFQLTKENLERVEVEIERTGAKLVVFDALNYFIGSLIRNSGNSAEYAPIFARLREIARRQNCAILNVRHFKKYIKGADLSEMGAGVVQWRASHRTIQALRAHPDYKQYPQHCLIVPIRGSMLCGRGGPYGYSIRDGVFGWLTGDDLAIFDGVFDDAAAEPEQGRAGREPVKLTAAMEWLGSVLAISGRKVYEVRKEGEALGFSAKTLYAASKRLKVIETTDGAYKMWHLSDPFAHYDSDFGHVYRGSSD